MQKRKEKQDLDGIMMLSNDPLVVGHVVGGKKK